MYEADTVDTVSFLNPSCSDDQDCNDLKTMTHKKLSLKFEARHCLET